MTVIIKGVDKSVPIYGRGFTLSSLAGDFSSGDVIDINSSIGGPGHNVKIDVRAGSSCTFRINSMSRRYPIYEPAKRLGFYAPDLQKGAVYINPETASQDMTAGEVLIIGDIPVSNIEFTALVGTVIVTVQS